MGLGEEKPAHTHPLSSRLRRNSALRGRTTGPKRWRSLVQHLIELLRGRSAVPLRRFFSKEQGAGHPSAKDVRVLFTALARPYPSCSLPMPFGGGDPLFTPSPGARLVSNRRVNADVLHLAG
jgi:hypothetical protein